jgi:trehalose utilization protein
VAIRVTVWNEFRHEKRDPAVIRIYPDGIHEAIAVPLRRNAGLVVSTASLDEPEAGLSEKTLDGTDVLVWWGHAFHHEVPDLVADRIYDQVVRRGMGFIALHSSNSSKAFRKLMGTNCRAIWREEPLSREILWVTRPGHPIVKHLDDHFILEQEEMYGEYFDIPDPETTFLISSFTGGEVFRSGCTWTRGAGRVVYFRPGHESVPSYRNAAVLGVIENACIWAARQPGAIEDLKSQI